MCLQANISNEERQHARSDRHAGTSAASGTQEVCRGPCPERLRSFLNDHAEMLAYYGLMHQSAVETMRGELDDALQPIAGDEDRQIEAAVGIFKKHFIGAKLNADAGMRLAWQKFRERERKSIDLEQRVSKLQKELAAWKHKPKKEEKVKQEHGKEIQEEGKANNLVDEFFDDYTRSAPIEKRKLREDVVRHLQEKCRNSICNERLVVHNDVIMEGYIVHDLEELPDICRVEGDLRMNSTKEGKSALKSLPEGLEVTGDLILENCFDLAKLPKKLTVGGSLKLSKCEKLQAVPEKIRIKNSLDLNDCETLDALPKELTLGGDLKLRNCSKLSELPSRLKVKGYLSVFHCVKLKKLPDNLVVARLCCSGCVDLKTVPKTTTVKGDISFIGCSSLTAIPFLEVNGTLNLSKCPKLTKLQDGLHVKNDLKLSKCVKLSTLPNRLEVERALDLSRCTNLTKLPEGLHVGHNLKLSDCAKLTELPEGLHVGHDLDLPRCTKLTELPEGLHVGHDLDLSDCTNLTKLPEGLHVGHYLKLYNCHASLPKRYTVREDHILR